jgi:hypothetical protein
MKQTNESYNKTDLNQTKTELAMKVLFLSELVFDLAKTLGPTDTLFFLNKWL